MRFIIMHKTNAHWESGAIPDKQLIARVGALLGEMSKAGVLEAGEGLRASSQGVRLRFEGGARTIESGPFAGANELPAAFSILRTASLDEAVEWATRQAEITGDVEIDIRPVTEPWDIGMRPAPAGDSTRRYMVLRKTTAASEAGEAASAETRSRLSQLIEETTAEGKHLVTETMTPSRRGRRYKNSSAGVTYFDGPLIETKELLGGYVIVSADSLEDACRWAEKYLDIVDAEEVDVREVE
jgi:hypothetical protein